MLNFSNFDFLVLHCNFKNFKWPVRSFFFRIRFFYVRFGISVPKDIKMGGVAIALSKNGDHNPAQCSTAPLIPMRRVSNISSRPLQLGLITSSRTFDECSLLTTASVVLSSVIITLYLVGLRASQCFGRCLFISVYGFAFNPR